MKRMAWIAAFAACSTPQGNTFDLVDTGVDTDTAPASVDSEAPPARDADSDGYGLPEDCLDGDPAVNPGAQERCNGKDDNCDKLVDQGPVPVVGSKLLRPLHPDVDGDGWGDPSKATWFCDPPGAGWIPRGGDCDDFDKSVFPGAGGSSCAEPAAPQDTAVWGDTDEPDTAPVPPYCGDGTVDSDEFCDDGDTTSGDGCSSHCTFERFRITFDRATIAATKPGGATWDFIVGTPPDPFLLGSIAGVEVFRSDYVLDNATPVWNEYFDVDVRRQRNLLVEVLDSDEGNPADPIGSFTLSHDGLNHDAGSGERTVIDGQVQKLTYTVVAR